MKDKKETAAQWTHRCIRIQAEAVKAEHPRYGYRRVSALLRL